MPKSPPTEYSHQFLEGMVSRMETSYHKYGPVRDAFPEKVDAIRCALLRLAKYVGTDALKKCIESLPNVVGDKNAEWLIDAANFEMIEFMHPSLKNAKFAPTDSKASPGRVWRDDDGGGEEISQRTNDLGMNID